MLPEIADFCALPKRKRMKNVQNQMASEKTNQYNVFVAAKRLNEL